MKSTVLWALMAFAQAGGAEELVLPHVRVTYAGIDAAQARALAETAEAARDIYISDFGFDMPETVYVEVTVAEKAKATLYTDGADRIFLKLGSRDQLQRPARTGLFNLYGICHELGHVAMYRLLRHRDWLTADAAEGWAHYAGSRVVDKVWEIKGESLWPDRYDYRLDGTPRLKAAMAGGTPSDVDRTAGAWLLLESIVGHRGFRGVFEAWNAAAVDLSRPAGALLAALSKLCPDEAVLAAWWSASESRLAQKRLISEFKANEIPPERLSGQTVELVLDKGAKDGEISIGGGGHSRRFKAPSEGEWYIRAVSIFGKRYGFSSDLTFDIALGDGDFGVIQTWQRPYARFDYEAFQWVRFEVPLTRVPASFSVGLDFHANATNGIYMAYDSATKGNSVTGAPGRPYKAYDKGEWMIRVELARAK